MATIRLADTQRVRVEMTIDGVTYDVELTQTDHHDATATLDVAHDLKRREIASGTYYEHEPTGNVTIELKAYGKLVKQDRRQAQSSTEAACALWYCGMGGMDYDLHDSEAEAADWALALEWSDDAPAILGVQFPDGRTIPVGEWAAYAEAEQRRRDQDRERAANPPPPIPTHTMRDPFRGEQVEVEDSSPSWVGR